MGSHGFHFNDPGIKTGKSRDRDDATSTEDVKNDSCERATVDNTEVEKRPESFPRNYFNWSSCHH